jgi:hypothetical protein
MTAAGPRVRVYLPATMAELAVLASARVLRPSALAYSVTPALQSIDPGSHRDEWEFEAFCDAAAASLALLDAAVPRRVVVSVDVDPAAVAPRPDAGATTVQLGADVPLTAVAAVHVDGLDAVPRVAAVLAGEPSDGLDDVALEWYDPAEIAALLAQTDSR